MIQSLGVGVGMTTDKAGTPHIFGSSLANYPALYVYDSNANFIMKQSTAHAFQDNPEFIMKYDAINYDETDIQIYSAGVLTGIRSSTAGTLDSPIFVAGGTTFVTVVDYSTTRPWYSTMEESQMYNGFWSDDKAITVSENYHDPSNFYSVGSETVNPNLGFVAPRAVEF